RAVAGRDRPRAGRDGAGERRALLASRRQRRLPARVPRRERRRGAPAAHARGGARPARRVSAGEGALRDRVRDEQPPRLAQHPAARCPGPAWLSGIAAVRRRMAPATIQGIMKPLSAESLTDEAQAVGADVVPQGVITTEETEIAPRTLLSEW